MDTRTVNWTWRDKVVHLNATEGGNGRTILLLPALSSISTRHEMRPLQERLAREYSTFSIDWPGFGDEPRPQIDWAPEIYAAFLSFLLTSVVTQPHAIIAAGHAAGYVLKHAGSSPQVMPRLVLIAPTWRGPLPTMMGQHRRFFDRLCRLVDRSTIGPLIYRLNVNPLVVRRMGAGHVYSDPDYLTRDRLDEKLAVVRAGGARFASVRFVTGRLDPLGQPRRISRVCAQCERSRPGDLRQRYAAKVADGDRGACGTSRHPQCSTSAWKALRARGVCG